MPNIQYKHYVIKKKTKGYRHIYAPNDELKSYQLKLLQDSFYKVLPHPAVHGFVPGKSIVTNAKPHVNKKYVLSLDIDNFFPSTTVKKVKKILSVHFPNQEKELVYLVHRGHLPQGAPTSPYLANFALLAFDEAVHHQALKLNATYTRYADDLTISWSSRIDVSALLSFLNKELSKSGYRFSRKKTKLMPYYTRQKVTGIVVNEKLSLPCETRNLIRAYNHLIKNNKFNEDDLDWAIGLNSFQNMVKLKKGG